MVLILTGGGIANCEEWLPAWNFTVADFGKRMPVSQKPTAYALPASERYGHLPPSPTSLKLPPASICRRVPPPAPPARPCPERREQSEKANCSWKHETPAMHLAISPDDEHSLRREMRTEKHRHLNHDW